MARPVASASMTSCVVTRPVSPQDRSGSRRAVSCCFRRGLGFQRGHWCLRGPASVSVNGRSRDLCRKQACVGAEASLHKDTCPFLLHWGCHIGWQPQPEVHDEPTPGLHGGTSGGTSSWDLGPVSQSCMCFSCPPQVQLPGSRRQRGDLPGLRPSAVGTSASRGMGRRGWWQIPTPVRRLLSQV